MIPLKKLTIYVKKLPIMCTKKCHIRFEEKIPLSNHTIRQLAKKDCSYTKDRCIKAMLRRSE